MYSRAAPLPPTCDSGHSTGWRPAPRHSERLAEIRAGDRPSDISERVSLFGLSTLPSGAPFLELLEAPGTQRDVHLLAHQPSPAMTRAVVASASTAQHRAGLLGVDQMRLLARVFANPRVKGAMVGRQEWFLDKAQTLPYKRFQERVIEWQRIIDEDGTEPAGDRVAKNRASTLTQDPTGLSWELKATFTSVDGAHNNQVHQHYVKVLFEADWAEAKARVGDGVCMADLACTDAQRRSDAWTQIYADAAASDKTFASATFRHNIVWSASAYEEMARRFAGAKAEPFDVDDYRCETIDGDPLDPTEAFANSMVNRIRRVIVGAKGVVIDMGTPDSLPT